MVLQRCVVLGCDSVRQAGCGSAVLTSLALDMCNMLQFTKQWTLVDASGNAPSRRCWHTAAVVSFPDHLCPSNPTPEATDEADAEEAPAAKGGKGGKGKAADAEPVAPGTNTTSRVPLPCIKSTRVQPK